MMIVSYRCEHDGYWHGNKETRRGKIKRVNTEKTQRGPFGREPNSHVSPSECDWIIPNLRDPHAD